LLKFKFKFKRNEERRLVTPICRRFSSLSDPAIQDLSQEGKCERYPGNGLTFCLICVKDTEVGRRVLKLYGAIPASNYVEMPA